MFQGLIDGAIDYESAPTRQVVAHLRAGNYLANSFEVTRLRVIAQCDLRKVYRNDDCDDMAQWLAQAIGISRWKARRLTDASHAMGELPVTTAAFERGELSLDQFVEFTRLATAATEAKLLSWAKRASPGAIRARADAERRIAEQETQEADRWRFLDWSWEDDNTRLWLTGSLPADQGTKFIKAVDRLAQKMPVSPEDGTDEATTMEARRADALVAMASASIAADPDVDRATVVLHIEAGSLRQGGSNGIVHGGRPLAPELTEMLMCDSRLQTVLHDDDGAAVGISSPSYVVPQGLRREVERRDGFRCAFANCGRQGFTQVHHIVPWPEGPTELSNLLLLCTRHHRLVHVNKWHVDLLKDGSTRWFRPDWTPYSPRPEPGAAA